MTDLNRTAAVVTISDSSHAGTREDQSGPAVKLRLEQAGFSVPVLEVVQDDITLIAATVRRLAETGGLRAVITTGGTGITARDVTPEALRLVIEKEIPGLGELMRAEGLRNTPRAVLSRSLAGVRGRVFIAALPGSPKGAVESLNAIVDLVPHILDLIDGNTAHPPETDGRRNAST